MMTKPINIVSPTAPATDTGWFAQDFGSPGQNWNMKWDPDLVEENALGGVNLSAVLNPAGSSHKYGAAEIRSTESFDDAGGIVLSVSLKFPEFHPPGVVIGAFTFPTVPWRAPGTELDFEVLASGIELVAHQYDGLGNRYSTYERIQLGFDPTKGFHTYEMALNDGVATWVVDGEVVAHMTAADTGRAFVNGRSTAYLDVWPAGPWAGRLDDTTLPFEAEFAGADFRSGTLATPDLQTGDPAANTLQGDAGKDQLFGKAGDDVLRGGGGDDRLSGGTGGDVLYGDEGSDVIEGGAYDDQLYGGGGDDTLDGGTASDHSEGGAGNDTYILDTSGDTVLEASGAGTDLVKAGFSVTLDANLEDLLLTGFAPADGTGNGVGNRITGNAAANSLTGLAGNDVLDGGMGVDWLEGGTGNDTYVLATSGDTVVEDAGAGTDEVRAGYSYTLSANVENLVLTGTSALDGAGNALANRLTGNAAANTLRGRDGNDVLDGGTGTDRLEGGAGNDTYVLATLGDTVVEGTSAGIDEVRAAITVTLADNVENLVLTGRGDADGAGNGLANRITGNAGSNSLRGGGGNDTMNGGSGADILTGGRGADVLTGGRGADVLTGRTGSDDFVFNSTAESGLGAQRDTITDFARGSDDIALSAIDANTARGGDQAFTLDAGGTFGTGEIRQTRSGSNLLIELNTDGDGAAEMSILLNNVTGPLSANDFLL